MRQIIIKKPEEYVETELNNSFYQITFEGITNYREEQKTAEALFYGIGSDHVLFPFLIPLQLTDGEDINDYAGIIIHRPIISSMISTHIVTGLIKKSGNEYLLQLSLPHETNTRYTIKLNKASVYIIAYALDCIYNHNMINTENMFSLYNLYREDYETLKLSYLCADDISIDKIHVSKDKILFVLLSFYTTAEDKSLTINHCLFIAELDKAQTKTLLRKTKASIKSIKFTDYETFKELCTYTESKVPVYLLEEPITLNYETKKGNALSRSIFINHHYKKVVVFSEAEFNKFLSDLTERITNL